VLGCGGEQAACRGVEIASSLRDDASGGGVGQLGRDADRRREPGSVRWAQRGGGRGTRIAFRGRHDQPYTRKRAGLTGCPDLVHWVRDVKGLTPDWDGLSASV
jgi:hypothetical protein